MAETTQARFCQVQTSEGAVAIPYRLHRRKGLRHLRVVVNESNEVVLKTPYGISQQRAVAFLESQGEWVWRVLSSAPPSLTLGGYLEENRQLSGDGRLWQLEIVKDGRRGARWDPETGVCSLHYIDRGRRDEELLVALERFAKGILPPRVLALAAQHGLNVQRVTVRDQRTRWGSCSARRTISLNWRLVLLPVELHDYIILHELAHLTHLNHSRRFWDLLASYDPQSQAHDRAVTEHSRVLMRLGRSRAAVPPVLEL